MAEPAGILPESLLQVTDCTISDYFSQVLFWSRADYSLIPCREGKQGAVADRAGQFRRLPSRRVSAPETEEWHRRLFRRSCLTACGVALKGWCLQNRKVKSSLKGCHEKCCNSQIGKISDFASFCRNQAKAGVNVGHHRQSESRSQPGLHQEVKQARAHQRGLWAVQSIADFLKAVAIKRERQQ